MRAGAILVLASVWLSCGGGLVPEGQDDPWTEIDAGKGRDVSESDGEAPDEGQPPDCISAVAFPEMTSGSADLPVECRRLDDGGVFCDPPCEPNPDAISMAFIQAVAVCQSSGDMCDVQGVRFPSLAPVEWAAWEGVIGADRTLAGGLFGLSVTDPPDSWRYSSCFRPPCCLPPREDCECVQKVDDGWVTDELYLLVRFPRARLMAFEGWRVVAVGFYYEVIGPGPWVSAAIVEASYLCPVAPEPAL
jgi:hypothetical protein